MYVCLTFQDAADSAEQGFRAVGIRFRRKPRPIGGWGFGEEGETCARSGAVRVCGRHRGGDDEKDGVGSVVAGRLMAEPARGAPSGEELSQAYTFM